MCGSCFLKRHAPELVLTPACRSGEAPAIPQPVQDEDKGADAGAVGGPKCSKEKNRQVRCRTYAAIEQHCIARKWRTFLPVQRQRSCAVCSLRLTPNPCITTMPKSVVEAGVLQAQRRFRERQKTLIGDLREHVRSLQADVDSQAKQIFVLQVLPWPLP